MLREHSGNAVSVKLNLTLIFENSVHHFQFWMHLVLIPLIIILLIIALVLKAKGKKIVYLLIGLSVLFILLISIDIMYEVSKIIKDKYNGQKIPGFARSILFLTTLIPLGFSMKMIHFYSKNKAKTQNN